MTRPFVTRPPLGEFNLNRSLHESHNREMRPSLHKLLHSARILRLPVETTFTAAVLLHRYKIASNERIDEWIIAICLLLACKREEEPRRLRDFINCSYLMQSRSLPDLDEAYWEAKKKIVRTEQSVLRWLAFDITVSRPHRAVVAVLLQDDDDNNNNNNNKQRDLALSAFRKLNHTIFSIEALQQEADALAIAALQLALLDDATTGTEDQKKELISSQTWGDTFDIQLESIQQVYDIVKRAATDKDSNR